MTVSNGPLVVVGELLWDLLPAGPRLGGAPTNFSILCARLGEPVTLVSRVGQDAFGDEALAQIAAVTTGAGPCFDTSRIQRSATLPTGTVSVTLDSAGRPQYTIDEPVAWDEIAVETDLLTLAAQASLVCFGTLAQRSQISAQTIRAFVEATSPGCIRLSDVNLRMPFCTAETLRWCIAHATVLKISDEELPEVARLLGDPALAGGLSEAAPIGGTDSAEACGDTLTDCATAAAHAILALAPHCSMVAITLGPHGSLLADRTGAHRHQGFLTKVADTIGAGDAFTAGMAHAYRCGAPLSAINEVANLCGSYVASQQGATPELPGELKAKIAAALSA